MQASYASSRPLPQGWLYEADVRAKIGVSVLASLGTLVISNLEGQLLLAGASLCYALCMRRPMALLAAYAVLTAMIFLAMGCVWIMGRFSPRLMGSMNFISLTIPFLRVLTMLHVVLPLALSSRVQNLLDALRGLKLPFCIYLPAAVIIRFIPTFINDVKQVTESLKMRGYRLNPWTMTRHPALSMRLLLTPLLFRSLRTSEDLGVAAELKGLGMGEKLIPYRKRAWTSRDSLLLAAALLVVTLAIACQYTLGSSTTGGMR